MRHEHQKRRQTIGLPPKTIRCYEDIGLLTADRAANGCWFLYLPPYPPDLNPIEQAFSKLKSHVRRIGARTCTDMFEAIGQICDLSCAQ